MNKSLDCLPACLIAAECRVVPYDDSRKLLGRMGDGQDTTLLGWATNGRNVAVRLYAAAGGYGKTRLALEAIKTLNADDSWKARIISRAALDEALAKPSKGASQLERDLTQRGQKGLFLALDYAETRIAQIERLAEVLAGAPSAAGPVRVVMLARTDEWWRGFTDRLPEQQKYLFEPEANLRVETELAATHRPAMFADACLALAEELAKAEANAVVRGLAPPALLSVDWKTRRADPAIVEASGNPLFLTFQAFLHVRGEALTISPLAHMAREERRHIARALSSRDPLVLDAAERSAALVTLCQGLSPQEVETTLGKLVRMAVHSIGAIAANEAASRAACDTIQDGLKRLYAVRGEIRPILPNLVGEHVAGEVLGRAAGLLATLFDSRDVDAFAALAVLNRATRVGADKQPVHDPARVVAPIKSAFAMVLQERLERLASPLVSAANTETGMLQDVAHSVLIALPEERRAAAGAAIITAASHIVNVNAVPGRLRGFLGDAARLALGMPAPIQLADQSVESLSQRSRALVDQSTFLSIAGQWKEALSASKAATMLRRELVAKNRDAFLPDLAASLNSMGTILSKFGQNEKALGVTEEAVSLRRELVAKNRNAFLADLASSLNNLGIRCSNLGRREEALRVTEEAITIRRELVATNRDAFLPDLAMSLNNQGNMFSNLGRREEALKATADAVMLYQELVAKNRDGFLPDLAMSLNNLGTMLSNLGRREGALTASEEAVSLRRELVAKNRNAFLSDLAMSLNNLGIRRSDFGRSEDALKATEEAATLYRELVARSGDAFLQELAMSLTNLGGDFFKLGRLDEALRATEEAVGLRKGLVAQNSYAFLPDLARSRALQGNILLASGRVPESIDAYAEAVRLLKPLAETKPQAFGSLWLAILQNLIKALQTAARSEAEIRSTLVMLGVQRGVAGCLFSAVGLFQAWADAHNAGRDDEADAAYAALRVTLDENKESPDLDLVRNAVDATLARLGHPQRYEAVLKKRSRGMSTDNGI